MHKAMGGPPRKQYWLFKTKGKEGIVQKFEGEVVKGTLGYLGSVQSPRVANCATSRGSGKVGETYEGAIARPRLELVHS